MLERVTNLLPNDITGLWGGTFHSVGNRILRRHAEAAGFAPGFSIMDREDQQDMLDSVIAASRHRPEGQALPEGRGARGYFSVSRSIRAAASSRCWWRSIRIFSSSARKSPSLQKRYEARKKTANSLDFDDLLEKTLRLLQGDAAIAEHYQRQFQFVLVDEYQDTNKIQADFIDILAARSAM